MNAMDGRKTGQQTVLALNVLAERQTISAENLPSQGNTLGSADQDEELKERISQHKQKMLNITHEYPLPETPYRIGVYIRFYNQTDHPDEEMLRKYEQEYVDIIDSCPQWTLVGFYVDHGASIPYMSKSREWCRLLDDCFRGKVNLIVTRLLRSVSKDVRETEMVARLLARQDPPIGIYFRSEDIFTLASYFRDDMTEREFLPEGWEVLPEDEIDQALKAGEPDSRRLSEGSE